MPGTNGLSMSYEDMQAEIERLNQYVAEFENITQAMNNSVNTLCDGWVSASTESYRQDYLATTGNFANTLEIVRELICSTNNYISDMQATDQAYAGTKVSN